MARNEAEMAAAPEAVWGVLADPPRYARFVVGTKRIRRFDAAWPQPGSALHHTVGLGPLVLRDITEAVDGAPPRRLRLHAGLRPLAVNEVVFTIEPRPAGRSRVSIEERPVRGPLATLWNPMLDGLLRLRNAELLRRLRRLAEEGDRTEGG